MFWKFERLAGVLFYSPEMSRTNRWSTVEPFFKSLSGPPEMFKNIFKRFTRSLKVFLSIVRDPGMSKHILNVWPNVLKLFYTFPGLPGNVGNC
jgi:hypothetical protein